MEKLTVINLRGTSGSGKTYIVKQILAHGNWSKWTDSNRRQLAAYEEQCLMQYDLGKHYLKRTFTFYDGSYKFGDIDWRAYHRFTNTKPSRIMLEELLP